MNSNYFKPNLMIGKIYFVEEIDLSQNVDFKQEFEDVENSGTGGTIWNLSRGIIIPNGDNDKLKFDIIPSSDYYECYFTGFLYINNSVLGKIKYIKDANESDVQIKGQYRKLSQNKILIRGIWINDNGFKEYFWLELSKDTNNIK